MAEDRYLKRFYKFWYAELYCPGCDIKEKKLHIVHEYRKEDLKDLLDAISSILAIGLHKFEIYRKNVPTRTSYEYRICSEYGEVRVAKCNECGREHLYIPLQSSVDLINQPDLDNKSAWAVLETKCRKCNTNLVRNFRPFENLGYCHSKMCCAAPGSIARSEYRCTKCGSDVAGKIVLYCSRCGKDFFQRG